MASEGASTEVVKNSRYVVVEVFHMRSGQFARGYLSVSFGWFNHSEPPRTFLNHV